MTLTYKICKYNDAGKSEILERNVLDIIAETDTYDVGGLTIIKLDGVKKIAAYEGIVLKDTPVVLASPSEGNQLQHWLGAWFGFDGDSNRDRFKFADGEASRLNTGKLIEVEVPTTDENGKLITDKDGNMVIRKIKKYDERSEIDSQYKGAMAYKRLLCRGILNFCVFNKKVYSDQEARAFSRPDTDY